MKLNTEKIEEILQRENLTIAPLYKRVIAYIIDDLLIAMIIMGIFFSRIMDMKGDELALTQFLGGLTFYIMLLRFLYHAIFSYLYGASICKLILKIRIIEISTLDTPSLLNCIFRAFFRELGQMLFYITYFFAIGDRLVRTLHDRIVKSVIVLQD